MNARHNTAQQAVQAGLCQKQALSDCERIFGVKHPEDVVSPIRVASERLTWLENLFSIIADDPKVSLQARRLAEMGRYVASDAADYTDCAHAELLEAIQKGGAA